MFITFEGIDFSGKTTQIDLLYLYLIQKGKEVIVLREPGGTDVGEKIRNILLSKENVIYPLTELFLFEASRYELVQKVIKSKLAEGYIVLCDRFSDSTTAYQGYGRGLQLDFIQLCNQYASGSLVPDITFYLDISINELIQRGKGFQFDRFESEKLDFIERVIQGFRKIADENPHRIIVIDGTKTIDEIHQKIIKIVSKKLMEEQ